MIQEITKDKELGGINESIDIDLKYAKDFKGSIKEDAKNLKGMVYTKEAGWGGNTKRTGQRFKKGAEDLIDAGRAAIQRRVNPITDMKNSTDFRNATTDFQRENPELAAVLNNEEKKGSAEYQEALGEYNNYVQQTRRRSSEQKR